MNINIIQLEYLSQKENIIIQTNDIDIKERFHDIFIYIDETCNTNNTIGYFEVLKSNDKKYKNHIYGF